MQRDEQVGIELEKMGFTIIRFWEQQIKKDLDACLEQVIEYITRINI
jgi:DNA mismatch endonuclease (patch repair protein)